MERLDITIRQLRDLDTRGSKGLTLPKNVLDEFVDNDDKTVILKSYMKGDELIFEARLECDE